VARATFQNIVQRFDYTGPLPLVILQFPPIWCESLSTKCWKSISCIEDSLVTTRSDPISHVPMLLKVIEEAPGFRAEVA
jgi:hypothetical protein